MGTVFGILFGVVFVSVALFVVAMRWGNAVPRFGRWLDRTFDTRWFDDST